MIYSTNSYSHYNEQHLQQKYYYDDLDLLRKISKKVDIGLTQGQDILKKLSDQNEKQSKQIESLEDKLNYALEKIDYLSLPPDEKEKIEKIKNADEVVNRILQTDIWMFIEQFIPELLYEKSLTRFANVYNFYNNRHYIIGEVMQTATSQPYTNDIEEYSDKEVLKNFMSLSRCGKKTAQVGLKIWRKAEQLLNEQKQIIKNIENK